MDHNFTITPSGDTMIIRTGEAEKIYPPRKVNITGNIQAPSEYFNKRAHEIADKLHLTHVIVDIENLKISLIINETNEFAEYISGTLELFKDFVDFGINRQKKYGIQELYKMLKLKRAYFQRREDHATTLLNCSISLAMISSRFLISSSAKSCETSQQIMPPSYGSNSISTGNVAASNPLKIGMLKTKL